MPTPISCYDFCDGSISVFTNNTANETFSWYNSSDSLVLGNTNVASNLCDDTYYFEIENNFQCFINSQSLDIGNLTLTNPEEFSIDISQSASVPNGLCNGIASITSSSGVAPLSYLWSNGQTTSIANNLCGNQVYNVEVTDANNCVSFEQFVINEEECDFSIGSLTTLQPSCHNIQDGQVYSVSGFSGGFAPYTISIYNNEFLYSEQTINSSSLNIPSLGEGNYNIIVQDAGGCFDMTSVQIVDPKPFSFSYTIENDTCYNSFAPEAHITITGGTPNTVGTPYDIDFFGFEGYFTFEENGAEQYFSGSSLQGGISYPLVVTDANNCSSPINPISDMFTVSVSPADSIKVNVSTSLVKCFGDSTGGASVNISGGTTPYQINWYLQGQLAPLNGSNTDLSAIDQLGIGSYYVSVKDNSGCETIVNFSITQPTEIVVSESITPPSCAGEEDGSISITSVSGGNGGYNYLWSPGGMLTDNVTSLSAGTYSLILIDQEGCEHVETYTIEDPQEVDIELIVTDETCNSADDGTLAANFSIPFVEISTIQWYVNGLPISAIDGGQSPSIVGLSAGTYSVEITTVNGCVFSSSASVGEPSPIELSVESTNPICFNNSDGTILAVGSGGASAFSYELTNGVGSIVSNSSLTENLIADTYTVTAINDNNCQISETVVLSNPNDIILNISSSNITCHNGNDGAASYSSTNSQAPFNQTWYSVIALNNNVPLSFESSLSDLTAGNYLLEIVDNLGCHQTETFSITEPDPLEVTVITTSSTCSNVDGGQAQVVSTGASPVNYLWTVNQNDVITVSGNVVTDLMPGSIFVSGTDANGCSLPLTEVVIPSSINPLVQVEIIQSQENYCFNQNDAVLDLNIFNDDNSNLEGSVSYQWYLNGSLIPGSQGGTLNTLSNLGAGEYTIVITEDEFDCTNADTIIIEEIDEFMVDILDVNHVSCHGQNSGSISTQLSHGTSPYSYNWNNSMGFIIANDVANPNNLIAGTYNLVVTDINGCESSQTVEILQNDSITFDLTSFDASCFNFEDGMVLASNINGGNGPISFQWENEVGEIVSIGNAAENLSSQMYYFTATDSSNCSQLDSIFVDQPTLVEISEDIVSINCYDDNTGSITLNVSGGTGNYLYQWDNLSSSSNQIIGLEAGSYSVNIIDGNGCQLSETYTVTQENEIVVTAEGVFQSCTQGFVNITNISGGVAPYIVNWLDDPVANNNTTILNDLQPGTYIYNVYDDNNCFISGEVTISGSNDIETEIVDVNDVLCHGDNSGYANINIINATNFPYTYSINDLASFNDSVLSTNFDIDNLTIGTYTIYIKDNEGCIDTVGTIEINQPNPLSLLSSVTDVVCYGETNGTIALEIDGGSGLYNVAIDELSNTVISNSSGLDTLLLSVGNYPLFVSDENNCIISDTLIIDEPQQIVSSLSDFSDYNGYNLSCFDSNDGFFTVNVSGGVGDYMISLNDSMFEVENGDLLANLQSGLYNLSIFDANMCSTQINVTLTAPDTLIYNYSSVSDFNGFNTTCSNSSDGFIQTVVSGGVGPYDYSSNGGITFDVSNSIDEQTFNNLSQDDYLFVVKDQNGCLDTIGYSINSPDEIIPNLSVNNEIDCYGTNQGALIASVQGGIPNYTYSLASNFDTVQVNSSEFSVLFNNLISGFYVLNVEDGNGCTNTFGMSSQIIVSQPDPISYTVDINSPNCNASNNGSLLISNISGGTSPYSLTLYEPSTSFLFEEENLDSLYVIPINDIPSLTYSLIITDASGCDFLDEITISEPDVLSLEVESSNISCFESNDGSISMSINGGTSPYSILLNGQIFSTNNSISFDNLEENTYSISVVDSLNCDATTEVIITQPTAINIGYTQVNNLCYNQAYGSVLFDVVGGTTPYQFEFTSSSDVLISESNNIDNLYADTYLFTVIDAKNCIDTQMVVITEPDEIIIVNDVTNISCPGASDGSISTSVSNFQESYDLFWQSENLSGDFNTNLSAGQYILTVVDNYGCFNVDTVNVMASNELSFQMNVIVPECSYINDGQVQLTFDGEQNYQSILTSPQYSQQMEGANEHLFNEVGGGDYILTVLYNSDCQFDTTLSVETTDGFDCIVPEPSFSPNFDGINDAFSPVSYFGEEVELVVFNRWGEKVFQEKSTNPTWDGTNFDGDLLPSADYYYIIKFNDRAFNDLTGIITLLK